jgi:hypothetical protein
VKESDTKVQGPRFPLIVAVPSDAVVNGQAERGTSKKAILDDATITKRQFDMRPCAVG